MSSTFISFFVKAIMWNWPFKFGHVSLMNFLNPPIHPDVLVTTKLRGFPLNIKYNPNLYIGKYIYYRGIFEEQIALSIAKELKPGMTFLDIGANIGLHTIIGAYKVGSLGKVISFEPQAKCRSLLKQNVEINGLNNVTIMGCALGENDSNGKIFHVNDHNDGQATIKLENESSAVDFEAIEIKTLSGVMNELSIHHADVVKVDIEGAELDMLSGGDEFFKKAKPEVVFIECVEEHLNRFKKSSIDLLQWFNDRGYNAYTLHRGKWRLIDSTGVLDGDLMMRRIK